jgi:hypothetical protein
MPCNCRCIVKIGRDALWHEVSSRNIVINDPIQKGTDMKQVSICILAAMLVLGTALVVAAVESPKQAFDGQSTRANITDFVTSDGRIDLTALQKSGYRGPLDLDGMTIRIDSATGEPAVSQSGTMDSDPDDVYWDNSISPSLDGMDNVVSAVTVYKNMLIVGGGFTIAGGSPANRIAAWDGNSWSPLGAGTNAWVQTLTVYDDMLIAGGNFTQAGGEVTNYIAAWDGTSWSSLGSGMDNKVKTLAVFNNELVAGGVFTKADGTPANYVAAWDGTAWSPVGPGLNPYYVNALTVYDNKLIAGGYFFFNDTDGAVANNIAAWDGGSWSALGTGTQNEVWALTTFNNQLIAGGEFTTAGGVSANAIASWDGNSWSRLGAGVDGVVLALTEHHDMLIAGGLFTDAGGSPVNRIAAWDGTSWSALGSGVNGGVHALTPYDNNLTVGGSFITAGDKVSAYLAQWTKGSATDVSDDPDVPRLPDGFTLTQNYPNPFNPSTAIEFELARRNHVRLEVFNLLGQSVRVLVDESRSAGLQRVEWDGTGDTGQRLATGVYFYRLQVGDNMASKKMLMLK